MGVTQVNEAPRIVQSSITVGRRSGAVRARAELRICDDSRGQLVVSVAQRRGVAKHLFAHSVFSRVLPGTDGGCRGYVVRWRVGNKFVGSGLYAVELRVRDADGAWSNRVGSVRGGKL